MASNWKDRQRRDRFVKEAKQRGYRSRAAFKLAQIDRGLKLLQPGARVLDLGAAPGGFSQIARERVGPRGTVVACDIRPMEPLAGVEFVHGDFGDPAVVARLLELAQPHGYDLVISDAAPNVSGVRERDEAEFLDLAMQILEVLNPALRPGGGLVVKLYQGADADRWIRDLEQQFRTVRRIKPEGSRPQSREIYVAARGYQRS